VCSVHREVALAKGIRQPKVREPNGLARESGVIGGVCLAQVCARWRRHDLRQDAYSADDVVQGCMARYHCEKWNVRKDSPDQQDVSANGRFMRGVGTQNPATESDCYSQALDRGVNTGIERPGGGG